MKRVLVTGASGFCGQHLCRYLMNKGYRVTGTYSRHPVKAVFPFIPLDMTHFPGVARVIKTLKPDHIYHLAAQSVPRLSWKMERETFKINTAGTVYLLEAVRRFSPDTKIFFTSSIQVYGRTFRTNKAVSELDIAWPESPYAASKLLAENACLNFYHQFGVQTVIARVFNHFGTGQGTHFVFSDWCRQIAMAEHKLKEPVLEVGNLDTRRDFLHVHDVIRAYELLMLRGQPGMIYNICHGRTRVLGEYVEFLLKKATIPLRAEVRQNRLRRNDPPVMRGNSDRLRYLGWKPRLSPLSALEDLLNEWRTKVRAE